METIIYYNHEILSNSINQIFTVAILKNKSANTSRRFKIH